MSFSVEHPDQTETLTFESRAALTAWARSEGAFWRSLGISGINSADRYVRSADGELGRLATAAGNQTIADDDIDQQLHSTAPKFYLSTGPRGRLLTSLKMLGHDPRTLTVTLAVLLGSADEIRNVILNSHWTYNCVIGTAHVAAFEAGGDPTRLVSLYQRLERYENDWESALTRTRTQGTEDHNAHAVAISELTTSVAHAEKKLVETTAAYETELTKIRAKFEEQFALRTPMTYWAEKADRHTNAARLYRRWFSSLLVGGTALLAALGYLALFPFLSAHPTAYWALILFSVVIALLAWPLRMTSKQYLVHQHLFEDASERAVIAKTFLALGDQVKLTDSDRQILLGALMRPASISLVSDDSGLNVADIIMAKTLTKS